MAITATFNLQVFNARNGYLVRDIEVEDPRALGRYANFVSRQDEDVVFGVGNTMPAGDWAFLLDQLAEDGGASPVLRLDVEPVRRSVDRVIEDGGFRANAFVASRGDDDVTSTGKSDRIDGWRGEDVIRAKAGADLADGGAERDTLKGNRGEDTLLGGNQSDVLRGGKGKDVLVGGKGSDRLFGGKDPDTFLFRDEDFGRPNGIFRDRILDFEADRNDQIVDFTGQLKVLAVGRIPGYGGREGTVLQHAGTGDQVFVEGAELRNRDIKRGFEVPPTPGPSEEIAPFRVVVEETSSIEQGSSKFVTIRVSIENFTPVPVRELEDLSFAYRDADVVEIPVLPTPNPSAGTSYENGVFSLQPLEGGRDRPPLLPGEERELFTYTYRIQRDADGNFPNVRTTPADFKPRGFQSFDPNDPEGEFDFDDLEIEIELLDSVVLREGAASPPVIVFDEDGVAAVETASGGGPQVQQSVDVYVRNTRDFPLTNLEDYEFDLRDDSVRVIGEPWGARFERADRAFELVPWVEDSEREPIEPGERGKAFGFTFTQPLEADPLEPSDFMIEL